MKNIRILILCAALCLALGIAGCNKTENSDDKITIVCTNFPLYDWTSQLLEGCDAEVILLLNNGTDMHSFQPSAAELIQIADCDVLVHVGGESDAWLMDALEANPNEARKVVNLMDVLEDDILKEHIVEGMQTAHTHEDGSVCTQEHFAEEQQEESVTHGKVTSMDEHIWLSLRMAVKSCEAIEVALCEVLPGDADIIRSNTDSYCEQLADLDLKYTDMIAKCDSGQAIIVADRFPFLYLAEDYGIEYYAAFPGCSTESEADFETVVFLAEKVKEYNTDTLLIAESGTNVLADTVFENAGVSGDIKVLHSMQVVYQSDIEAGASYISYMEANMEVLEEILQ